ncbi:MAG: hypothetical protein LAO03_21450 [Acidobacteriia bacterium]|nr:hypothetical protein [Terriglobia bacterium]
MVKLHFSHNQKNTEALPDFVLQTVSGMSRHGSEGDLTSNRNNLPRPSRWNGTEHEGFAHFAVIARFPLEYASFTYYFRTPREFFQWSIRTFREDSCPDQ